MTASYHSYLDACPAGAEARPVHLVTANIIIIIIINIIVIIIIIIIIIIAVYQWYCGTALHQLNYRTLSYLL